MTMNAHDIRTAYLEFCRENGHEIIPRASIVTTGDSSTLFTGSGMQPMIPYLLGEPHPNGVRLANSQTCLRAEDMDEVGDNRHTTAFEMLGNWSLGDYFKKEQVPWMFEFLTEIVRLDPNKLYITCFIGAPEYDIPKDTEAAELWAPLFEAKGITAGVADIGSEADGYARGIKPGERIFYYDGSKNWWSRNGGPKTTPVGDPCGPDSEMFYDFGTPHNPEFGEHCHPNCDCGRFMEIGNNVFMAYKKVDEGKFELLKAPNIDHGSGLERIAAAALDTPDVYKISLLWPIIEALEQLSGKTYAGNETAMRVIADHFHAALFLAIDGVSPSNKEQGYVMRRLLRRAIRFGLDLDIENDLATRLVPVITDLYAHDFPEVDSQREVILELLQKEEKVFRQTLRKGLKEFDKLISVGGWDSSHWDTKQQDDTSDVKFTPLGGDVIFKLYDTYGFPMELSVEEAKKRGITLADDWSAQFDAHMQKQREMSRTATKGQFKGGLGGQTLQHIKYHTATHLMYAALKQVLGDHVTQHGSNITEDRLRFDFNHPEKVTREQLDEVERIVNEKIAQDLPISFQEYPTKTAFDMGAIGAFGDKYGDMVKVYQMGEGDDRFSFEICGGPHVDHTHVLSEDGKKFKITKEESSSAGIRRIKAVLA